VLPAPAPRPSTGAPQRSTSAAEFFAAAQQSTASTSTGKQLKKKKGGRGGRTLKRFFALVVMCGFAVGAYVGVTRVLDKSNQDELPTFTTPAPAYESVTFQLSGIQAGAPFDVTVETDADDTVLHMIGLPDSGILTGQQVIIDGETAFVSSPDGAWTLQPYTDEFGSYSMLAESLKVFRFDDVVPASMRHFTELVSKSPDRVTGRDLTRYELSVRMGDFKTAEPDEYDDWSRRIGAVDVAPDVARFVFWVDDQGIVWQQSTYADSSDDTFITTVVSYSRDPVPIVYPTQYTDLVHAPAG
jgi:hypothetical protein